MRVAAICYVLANISRRFNPDQAMLAGLLHDIGLIPVYSYLDEAMDLVDEELGFDDITQRMRAPVGAKILRAWEFGEDMVTACREAELWGRNTDPQPDLADLVVLAQLHSFIGSKQINDKPALDEVPAFGKLFGKEMNPKDSLKILRRAQQRIDMVERMLQG